MAYILNQTTGKLTSLKKYKFKSEGHHLISPQIILAKNPQVFTDLNELELGDVNIPLVITEFNTSRGPIDILYITSNADIILVETKLLRNPESHRVVVAQCIDYIKALTKENFEDLLNKSQSSKYSDSTFNPDEYFRTALKKNLDAGNFKVIIAGDYIHPNILEMVDSLQSAPHLSFTFFLVELNAYIDPNEDILLFPKIVSQTIEIERAVIKLEFSKDGKLEIDSSTPEKERKGSKPILSEEEYLNMIEPSEFAPKIHQFIKEWRKLGGIIHMGTVGISAGIMHNGKRIPVQYIMQNKLDIISQKWRDQYEVTDKVYNKYMNYFKDNLPDLYDKYIIGGKVSLKFTDISNSDIEVILTGAFEIIK